MEHVTRNMEHRTWNRRGCFMLHGQCSKECGFTLIELLIASGLFLILVALASGTFVNTLRTQRIVVGLTEDMNNAAFSMEQIAREARVGFDFESYAADTITFTNSNGDDVTYSHITNGGRGGIGRCIGAGCTDYEPMTSPDVNIENLEFILQGEERGDGFPPRITMLVTVLGEKNIRTNLQTTISARIIDT